MNLFCYFYQIGKIVNMLSIKHLKKERMNDVQCRRMDLMRGLKKNSNYLVIILRHLLIQISEKKTLL